MENSRRSRWRSRQLGYGVAWVAAAAVAVTIGLVAVSTVGASVRDRGPLGNEVQRGADQTEGRSVPDSDASRIARTIEGAFGEFEVECRGVVAYGLSADTRGGWRTVSYEPGPDDDVDAVFAHSDRSIELEVYCNQGRPTIAEREYNTLPD
jgi:hypothetical protein